MKVLAAVVVPVCLLLSNAHAQPLRGPPADPQFKVSTPMPPDAAVPNSQRGKP